MQDYQVTNLATTKGRLWYIKKSKEPLKFFENRIIFGPIYLFRVGSDWKDIKVNKNDLVVAKCVTPLQMLKKIMSQTTNAAAICAFADNKILSHSCLRILRG